jgi:predicted PurR-regulated permease PerM
MTSKTLSNGILRTIGILCAIAIAFYFLYQVQTVIIYLIVGLILTLIGNPIQTFFKQKLKFKNTLSAVATLTIFIMIIVGFALLFVPLLSNQSQNLSVLNTGEIEKNIETLIQKITVYLEQHHIDSNKIFKQTNLTSKLNFQFIPNFINSILSAITSFGMGLASVLFITFFFLKDKVMFIIGVKKILPDTHQEKILNSLDQINVLLSRYFIGILTQLSIVFVLYFIVLLIFGIQNSLIIAFLCAILNIIPYVGPLIASILAAVLTMLSCLNLDFQTQTIPTTIYVLIGFWLVQIIDNNLCQPIIFSNSVKSHPLEIFLVILAAGFLFGITGMIIAVPLFTILKVIAKEFLPENKVVQELTKKL